LVSLFINGRYREIYSGFLLLGETSTAEGVFLEL